MKQGRKWLVLLILTLMLGVTAAQAEMLPQEVQALFDVKAWAHYAIAAQPKMVDGQAAAYWQDGQGYEVALVVMRNTKSKTNVLVMLEKESAKAEWQITMRNWNAVEQGDESVPVLAFSTDGELHIVYPNEETAVFQHKSSGWKLVRLLFGENVTVTVAPDYLEYRTVTTVPHATTQRVNGVVETSLNQFSLDRFPKTAQAAKERLTNPPQIPSGSWRAYAISQPSAYADKLPAGLQYEVYSAPSEQSFRAANGRATLSTNDWVQLLGEEGDYLLVQYALNAHQYRIGYIQNDGRVDTAEVTYLTWANAPAVLTAATSMTDDPLNSCDTVLTLNRNAEVTYLGCLGADWAYIETTTPQGQCIRGFVPMSDLELIEEDLNG